MDQAVSKMPLEARLRAIEDRLEIYNLIASHPPSADTGADYYTSAVYTEDGIFDRGEDLDGASATTRSVHSPYRRRTNNPSKAASPISPGYPISHSTAMRPTSRRTCRSSIPTRSATTESYPIMDTQKGFASTASSPTAGP